ncbi:MAG: hydantoinase/oxoprolinase family protein [Halobacteriales archaeon]|nr:hydantoinase/oxoprolinase family protein [Halobacteriales archaeon]
MSLRIGIDVGGTNTDAAVLDDTDTVIAETKAVTTADVTEGIINALTGVLDEGIEKAAVEHVMLGTTHCTNAVTERKGLNDIAVVRVGKPATQGVPPLYEWDGDLRAAIGDTATIVRGGHEFDGREITDLDKAAVREFLGTAGDIDGVAITSVFSPVREEHEQRVAEIAHELHDDITVSRSREIGSIGLLERENATALNAALTGVMRAATSAFRDALADHGIDARTYIGQNDGTLMDVEYAERYPIFTVASGPANSIRGAAYLSDITDGIIVDVGGTTTDVGALSAGFPRESAAAVEVGGVRTNFRMPDLLSIGIGGGSIVTDDEEVTVGPESVGYRLTDEALAFGGETLTATDIAIAQGRAAFGTTEPAVEGALADRAEDYIVSEIEYAIDRMKTGPDPVPVVIVGGGSILLPADIEGAAGVEKPPHFEVANAIGAAIAQVSGDVDRVYSLDEQDREAAVEDARAAAREKAIAAGADPATVEIVDFEEVPLAYLPGNAIRMRAKAAGDLAMEAGDA